MNPNMNPGALYYTSSLANAPAGTSTVAGNVPYAGGIVAYGGTAPAANSATSQQPVTQAPTTSTQTLQPAVDPSIYQYYDQLAGNTNAQLGRLPGQQQVGQQNISDAFTTASNTLNAGKNVAQRDYQTAKDQALQNETQNEGDINFTTGQQTNALQRLLGSAGFGSSLAATQAVPYATGMVGAGQLRNSQQAFGRNNQALDTNFGDYTNNWQNALNDASHQRDTQTNALQSSIDQNKASLLQQLASIAQQRAAVAPGASYADITKAAQPYQDQISSLGGQIDALGRQYANPVIAANAPAYQAPSLESYLPQQTGAQIAGAPGANSNLGQFTNLLLGAGQQQQQQNLAGQPLA